MKDIAELDRALLALRKALADLPELGRAGTPVVVDSGTLATIRAAFGDLDDAGAVNRRPTAWGGHLANVADAMRGGRLGSAAAARRTLDYLSEGHALPRRVPGTSGR